MDNLNIKELNLEGNCITSYKYKTLSSGIKSLINLRTIILGHNKLSSLNFFKVKNCFLSQSYFITCINNYSSVIYVGCMQFAFCRFEI